MNKQGNIIGILIVGLLICIVLAAVVAAEVFVLLFLGFTYETWQGLAIFLVVFGIVEFILSALMKGFIEDQCKSHHNYHAFWGHVILSFTLLMLAVSIMESIYIPTIGAMIYAVLTALLYVLVDKIDVKNE